MGYYSDVALCVSERVEIPEETRTLMDSMGFNQESACQGSALFIARCLKWYDPYPEIRHLIDWIASLEDEEYLFLRIGEDMNDTESCGVFYGNPFNLGFECQFCYDALDDTL